MASLNEPHQIFKMSRKTFTKLPIHGYDERNYDCSKWPVPDLSKRKEKFTDGQKAFILAMSTPDEYGQWPTVWRSYMNAYPNCNSKIVASKAAYTLMHNAEIVEAIAGVRKAVLEGVKAQVEQVGIAVKSFRVARKNEDWLRLQRIKDQILRPSLDLNDPEITEDQLEEQKRSDMLAIAQSADVQRIQGMISELENDVAKELGQISTKSEVEVTPKGYVGFNPENV